MKKNRPVAKLHKILWPIFSKVVRLEATDVLGYSECVTCNRRYHWKKQQAGHFIIRSYSATLYDRRNVHNQCYRCNCTRGGEQYLHSQYIEKVHGEGVCERLWGIARAGKQYKAYELEGMIKVYKAYLKALMKEKGVEV